LKNSKIERPPANDDIIIIDRVYKSFGKTKALIDVSLRVKRGEVCFIFGPSGGGKKHSAPVHQPPGETR